jgi:hypothetical protein
MIDLPTARECVAKHLHQMEIRMNAFGSALPGHGDRPKHHLVIVSEREYDFGWVFCYNIKEYMDSRNTSQALAGNAPLILDRGDGKIYVTGTAPLWIITLQNIEMASDVPLNPAAHQTRVSRCEAVEKTLAGIQKPPFRDAAESAQTRAHWPGRGRRHYFLAERDCAPRVRHHFRAFSVDVTDRLAARTSDNSAMIRAQARQQTLKQINTNQPL